MGYIRSTRIFSKMGWVFGRAQHLGTTIPQIEISNPNDLTVQLKKLIKRRTHSRSRFKVTKQTHQK